MLDPGLAGRVALVTGANQGIGAATARALAAEGVFVFLTYLRLDPAAVEGDHPPQYGALRARTADDILTQIRRDGGTADAIEADLADVAVPAQLFDRAERAFGPVEILVNNASGWLADTFLPQTTDWLDRGLRRVDATSHERQFAVDARAAALLRPGPAHHRAGDPPELTLSHVQRERTGRRR